MWRSHSLLLAALRLSLVLAWLSCLVPLKCVVIGLISYLQLQYLLLSFVSIERNHCTKDEAECSRLEARHSRSEACDCLMRMTGATRNPLLLPLR